MANRNIDTIVSHTWMLDVHSPEVAHVLLEKIPDLFVLAYLWRLVDCSNELSVANIFKYVEHRGDRKRRAYLHNAESKLKMHALRLTRAKRSSAVVPKY